MKPFKYGFVVGKFLPLHNGHVKLIKEALKQSEFVFLLSYTSQIVPKMNSADREDWLIHMFPNNVCDGTLQIRVINPTKEIIPNDEEDAIVHREFCRQNIDQHFGKFVNAVFTSEEYGDGLAEYLTKFDALDTPVVHVSVDQNRSEYPISGTMIRDKIEKGESIAGLVPKIVENYFLGKRILMYGSISSNQEFYMDSRIWPRSMG